MTSSVYRFDESTVEQAAKEWLAEIGYRTGYAPVDAPVGQARETPGDCVLWSYVAEALVRLNPRASNDLVRSALARIQRAESQDVMSENQRLHELMVAGVPVETTGEDGRPTTVRLRLVDFNDPANNDWRALNQFTVVEGGHNRRPDVLVFLNGLPVGLMELKNPTDEKATLRNAWNQIQTYRKQIPSVFFPNVITVISEAHLRR
ncbi:Type I restriction enzyme R protein N terminus (HSDR_N) [Schaalia meyeri]|nr:type I restriction endonuclease [Schaalia meyeri]SDR64420.1 Type I restriction enzyme R protein N terminus (HSDR_N) [Schaalia meyeri]